MSLRCSDASIVKSSSVFPLCWLSLSASSDPDNVFFNLAENIKLANFGSANWFGDDRTMSSVVGAPYYVAPKVLLRRDYDEKVDVGRDSSFLRRLYG
ncbi:hypothetical protein Fmac_026662 [Flemingia macrophylla]|uniref:Protein kinase domain-containing protein n=1 Tax=Flemingia macrophylla TaxID=520843 RepID=A0ABD1LFR6_9FABA